VINHPPIDTGARAAAPARSGPIATERQFFFDLAVVLIIGLGVRLALAPFAGHDSYDHALRVWIAWRWVEDPFPLTYGVWGPLHFFLMAPVIALFDPILAPVLLHVALGALVPLVVYLFTREEFGSRGGALAAAIAFALYPVAILNSLSARSETPFVLLAAIAILALSRTRRGEGLGWAVGAGIAMTLAAMLRYEGWMLIPPLAVILWPRWSAMAAFLACAMVFPVISMVSNFVEYGHPLYGIAWASQHELETMGKAGMSLGERAGQLARFVANLVGGMTPLLALMAGLGALVCLIQRRRQAIWLIPCAVLGVLLFASALRGTLVPKVNYTATLGLLLIPFLAAFLTAPPFQRLGRRGQLATHILLFGSMLLFLVIGTLRDVPGMRDRSMLLSAMPAIGPVPGLSDRLTLDGFAAAIRAETAESGEAFISDFLGFSPTGYLALATGVHRDRIYLPSAAPRAPVEGLRRGVASERLPLRRRSFPLIGNVVPELAAFLRLHPQGVIVLQPGSRLAGWLAYDPAGSAEFDGVRLELDEIARTAWPLPAEPSRLEPGGTPGAPGELIAFRYEVVDAVSAAPDAP
jgi:hypothetical protein